MEGCVCVVITLLIKIKNGERRIEKADSRRLHLHLHLHGWHHSHMQDKTQRIRYALGYRH